MKLHLPLSNKNVRGSRRRIGAAMAACVAALCLGGPSAVQASITIIGNFDSSFTSNFGANAAAAETAWNNAAAVYMNTFSASPGVQNATITITVSAVAGTNVFGESSAALQTISYANLQAALAANAAKSGNPDQLASVAASGSLGTSNPDTAATYWLNTAQARALGVLSGTGTDGQTIFGAGNAFFFGTSGTPAGQFYFEGVALHEISEVMGRLGLKSGTIGGHPDSHSLLDLLAFFGPGNRSLTNGTNAFFSIDQGNTLLKAFNNDTVNGLDSRDWLSNTPPPNPPADAYNQFSFSGVDNGFSAVDLREMNVLGYDLPSAAVVPEPSTLAIAGLTAILGLGSCILRKRRPAA
jgi:hypothetical protein